MDTTTPSQREDIDERLKKLEPPSMSHASIVLNGAFNGASIIGGISSLRDWHLESKGKLSNFRFSTTTIFATIAGTAIGAWFGAREAHNLNTYQNAVNHEIRQLRADVDAHIATKEPMAR